LNQRPTLSDAEGIIPDDKRGDKTLSEIIGAIKELLKPYRKNYTVGIEMADDKPYIIRINYEIFLK
jgi:hypothetical protein